MAILDILKYDNLFAGDADIITDPILIDVSQDIQRGDILKKVNGKYQKADALITVNDVVIVASENIITDESTTATSIGYKAGKFNANAMRFGGASTAEQNKDVLAEKSIYITFAQKQ